MEFSREGNINPVVLSCDGDPTIREGDWLRLWNSFGPGVAHDVWVGTGGIVYENSGPGGFVRPNTLTNVLEGRQAIQIVARTRAEELEGKVAFAESKIGTLWAGFYNCQDFASEVATGKAQSFQREGILALSAIAGGFLLFASQQQPRRRPTRRLIPVLHPAPSANCFWAGRRQMKRFASPSIDAMRLRDETRSP